MLAIDTEQPGPRAACLLVFLPGGGDSARSFTRYGFVEDVLATHYSIDMVSADATMGYYTRGSFVAYGATWSAAASCGAIGKCGW